jgi:hypothetical protein
MRFYAQLLLLNVIIAPRDEATNRREVGGVVWSRPKAAPSPLHCNLSEFCHGKKISQPPAEFNSAEAMTLHYHRLCAKRLAPRRARLGGGND